MVLVIEGCGSGRRIGLGSRFELDRGAQLADRGAPRQRRIVLIGTVGCPLRDHPDLIQRQPALPQALGAAGELRQPARDGGDRVRRLPKTNRSSRPATPPPTAHPWHRTARRDPSPPRSPRCAHQSRCADRPTPPTPRTTPQDARQGAHRGARRCGRGHDVIIAARYDKSGLPDPPRGVCPQSSAKRCSLMRRCMDEHWLSDQHRLGRFHRRCLTSGDTISAWTTHGAGRVAPSWP